MTPQIIKRYNTLEKLDQEPNSNDLFNKIGRLELENDFLKKNLKKLGHL
ncbi:hypothetical protein [Aureibacter tunicatorum]|uniref:Transposase n=1 Tax=Aureibacter tunicatorum TaxID=866807 RepID=A0AAE3XP23_9BACT|nr:hypothetical protein [Aureibacter tunicatorum]MDR6241461.1 hypothetical protein [Aureibacter tunicatorum]